MELDRPVDELQFYVNGKKIVEKNADPEMTLLYYLRRKLGLTGTKLGCAEGGCGACTVMVSRFDVFQKKIVHYSVNACLAPICSLHNAAVTTVEGIGSTTTRLHPVQERIAKAHGSQCGFCTPGFVMSMYTLLRNNPKPTMEETEETFQGNLCRCTGYRPILKGYSTFAVNSGCCGKAITTDCCMEKNKTVPTCCKTKGSHDTHCLNRDKTNPADLVTRLYDPSEFKPLDPTQEPIFPPELQLHKTLLQKSVLFRGERVTWIQPSNLGELLELKLQYPNARLVVGNTEVGIEMKFKDMLYPVILAPVCIPELKAIQQTETGITFGGACTLTFIKNVLQKAVEKFPEYQTETFKAVLEQLKWFAGEQIRNVAAVAGNIMTASPISDLNPVFMSAQCKVTVASKDGTRAIRMDRNFFSGYRKTVVKPHEILLAIEIPFTKKGEFVSVYKQSTRQEDDIAIVNSAMRVLFREGTNTAEEIRLCYGGMSEKTALAQTTCETLKGREWNEALLEEACKLIAKEMTLEPSAPGGMVKFRRTLAISFFFKFYLTVLQKLSRYLNKNNNFIELIPPSWISATELFHRDPPSSVQLFQAVPPGQCVEDVVGRPIMHLAAEKQATGEAVYCDDMPHFENELYLAVVTSTKPHAKIIAIDPTDALKMPGVVDFISAKDVPGSNLTGHLCFDETVFAEDTVTCIGYIIGAILADTQPHARRAAKAVKITYEELKPIITIQEAIENESFFMPIRKLEKGDIKQGFEEADHILEGEMHMGGQDHFYMETHCTIAVPKKENGEMELFASTQAASATQGLVAKALGVPSNRIVCRVKRMGGGFGGKESRTTMLSTVVAVAAHKAGRPVRCMYDRDEDMLITGGRHPFLGHYKVGFMKNGKIVALDVTYYSNAGNSMDLSIAIMERALLHMTNAYQVPNTRGVGYMCKTNLSSNTAFRGFGGPQAMMIAECWINDIALTCALPADQVRFLNLYKEGEITHYNLKLENCTVQRCWEECLAISDYHNRQKYVEEFNRQHRWRKRGIAVIPTVFGLSFTVRLLNQAGALVHIYKDGSVLVTHAGTEMGQGLHTKIVQIAGRALQIPADKIYISETSTNTVPNTSPTSASVSSDLNGMAVYNACQILLQRLKPFKEANPSGTWEEWVIAAYIDRVSLSATGFYKTPEIGYDFEKSEGMAFSYMSYGVACSEVEVDCLTGGHMNLRTDIVMDVGFSLNPAIDIGQVEGAFVQGLGLFTLEELRYSPEGFLYTRGPGMYKIPTLGDIPLEFNVTLLRDSPNSKAIYSSKGVGEPPLFLSSSVFFAIKDAIAFARADSGITGPFRLDSPATPERIRNACVDQFTKMCPSANPGTFKPWAVQV